jgi:pSer/pThr/pTyr-binding forkhead associated (FHA) protein
MARLILSLDGQTLAEYNMTKERYTVGRLPDNDIRIDNAAVSGHHSLIINILNDSFLEDLNSTNGTYVNGKLIKKHALQQGDVVTVGHHQLRYVDDQAANETEDEFEKTMVIEPNGKAEQQRVREAAERATAAAMGSNDPIADADRPIPDEVPPVAPVKEPMPAAAAAGGQAAAAVATAVEPQAHTATQAEPASTQDIDPAKVPKLPLARLQVLSGTFAGRELELSKALTTLGRPGVQVAAVCRRAEGYFIVTVEARSEEDYPLVNGMTIGDQARKLEDNDVVQLAGVKMGFFVS